jgi:hypothetical protein
MKCPVCNGKGEPVGRFTVEHFEMARLCGIILELSLVFIVN